MVSGQLIGPGPGAAGPRRSPWFAAWPIRRKLLAMVLLPLLGVLPLLGLLLLVWGNAALDRLLITKVRSDLEIGRAHV